MDPFRATNDISILVIPKTITKLGVTITNKETFPRFQIKFTSSDNINMNIRKTTEYFKKRRRKVYLFVALNLFKYSTIQRNL